MPAFVILGIMVIKIKGLGLLLIPAIYIYILGFTLIFSLAVSEMVKLLYDSVIDIAGLGSSLVFSIMFLILTAQHLRKLKLELEEIFKRRLHEDFNNI